MSVTLVAASMDRLSRRAADLEQIFAGYGNAAILPPHRPHIVTYEIAKDSPAGMALGDAGDYVDFLASIREKLLREWALSSQQAAYTMQHNYMQRLLNGLAAGQTGGIVSAWARAVASFFLEYVRQRYATGEPALIIIIIIIIIRECKKSSVLLIDACSELDEDFPIEGQLEGARGVPYEADRIESIISSSLERQLSFQKAFWLMVQEEMDRLQSGDQLVVKLQLTSKSISGYCACQMAKGETNPLTAMAPRSVIHGGDQVGTMAQEALTVFSYVSPDRITRSKKDFEDIISAFNTGRSSVPSLLAVLLPPIQTLAAIYGKWDLESLLRVWAGDAAKTTSALLDYVSCRPTSIKTTFLLDGVKDVLGPYFPAMQRAESTDEPTKSKHVLFPVFMPLNKSGDPGVVTTAEATIISCIDEAQLFAEAVREKENSYHLHGRMTAAARVRVGKLPHTSIDDPGGLHGWGPLEQKALCLPSGSGGGTTGGSKTMAMWRLCGDQQGAVFPSILKKTLLLGMAHELKKLRGDAADKSRVSLSYVDANRDLYGIKSLRAGQSAFTKCHCELPPQEPAAHAAACLHGGSCTPCSWFAAMEVCVCCKSRVQRRLDVSLSVPEAESSVLYLGPCTCPVGCDCSCPCCHKSSKTEEALPPATVLKLLISSPCENIHPQSSAPSHGQAFLGGSSSSSSGGNSSTFILDTPPTGDRGGTERSGTSQGVIDRPVAVGAAGQPSSIPLFSCSNCGTAGLPDSSLAPLTTPGQRGQYACRSCWAMGLPSSRIPCCTHTECESVCAFRHATVCTTHQSRERQNVFHRCLQCEEPLTRANYKTYCSIECAMAAGATIPCSREDCPGRQGSGSGVPVVIPPKRSGDMPQTAGFTFGGSPWGALCQCCFNKQRNEAKRMKKRSSCQSSTQRGGGGGGGGGKGGSCSGKRGRR